MGGERKRNGVGGNKAEGLETVHQAPYQLRASHSKGGADGDLTYLEVPLGSKHHIRYTQDDCAGEGKINSFPVHPLLSPAVPPNGGGGHSVHLHKVLYPCSPPPALLLPGCPTVPGTLEHDCTAISHPRHACRWQGPDMPKKEV